MNTFERLEAVCALVRARLPGCRSYRGQGRRPELVRAVLQLVVYLAKHNQRNLGDFPIDRRALRDRLGVPEHVTRSAIKLLTQAGVLHKTTALSRKPNSVHFKPDKFVFCDAVKAIFATNPEPVLERKKEEKKEGIKSRPIFRAGMAAGNAVKDAAKALLRSLFPGSDEAFEAHWRSLPGR